MAVLVLAEHTNSALGSATAKAVTAASQLSSDVHVLVAGSASEGLEFLAVNRVGVILTDQNMPQISGIEFLNRVRQLYPDPVRIVLSAYSDLKLVNEAFRRGAIYKYINKPWDEQDLLHTVQEAFRQYELQRAR